MNKNRMQYVLGCSYDLSKHAWGSLDDALDMIVGESSAGSGTGFGQRDVDWYFTSATKRNQAFHSLESLQYEMDGIRLWVDDYTEED